MSHETMRLDRELRDLSRRVEALEKQAKNRPGAIVLTARERDLCLDALGIWRSDYNDVPFDEVEALRIRLIESGGGK